MNGFCHIEIPSRDFTKAKKFYSELFSWNCNEAPEMNYMVFQAPDGPGGGFSKTLEFNTKPGILFYIEVESIENIVKKAEEIGGKCSKEKTQISPEYGYYAVLNDLEGNTIGIWAKS
jgi:predicted enzyme related to lactoylglutathione lyase